STLPYCNYAGRCPHFNNANVRLLFTFSPLVFVSTAGRLPVSYRGLIVICYHKVSVTDLGGLVPGVVVLAVVLFALASLPSVAQTTNSIQSWPTKPVTLVVPFPAGSASDVVARILSPRLGELLKTPVVIENVAGAGRTTGALRVARAAPDGYQVAFGVTGTHSQ